MTSLPTGTVAFLMSDIEGSTRLIGLVGDEFPRLLDQHHGLMREAVAGREGTVVSTEGDSVFAAFHSARQAIGAAIDAQRALAAHPWPGGVAVKVRIGLHAGEAVMRGRDYAGLDVHRTARIMAAAWGGQVLASEAVRALAGDALPSGCALRDLGTHQLRDMPAPERLYQLVAPGLATSFPAPRVEATATRTNLPTPVSRLVGRSEELEAVRALLEADRLVTLTGPGGSGKTRLAIEAARGLQDAYPDGVWFVALEAVRDAELVLPTIAQTLGVPEQPGRPVIDVLSERLVSRRVLLVLDNLEQVIDAAPDVARLLEETTALAVLASSREPLAVAGERVFAVLPLALPAEADGSSAAEVERSEAVQLFVERARAARPDLTLTDANAPAIAAICRRLDGLPLAIELAAARMNVLSPEEILQRLDRSLALLATTRRDLPARQRTLRGAIDWSHELLSDPERAVFRRCSVFAGGMALESLEAIVDPERTLAAELLDVLGTLVDRSLLRSVPQDGRTRFAMLETIREYAAERLAAAGEARAVQARHAEHFAAMAEKATHVLVDRRRDEILDGLDRELGNLRAAIAWSLGAGETDTGLRLATGLNDFWHLRNHIAEGVRALEELVAASSGDGDTVLRARGLLVAGGLLTWLGEPEGSRALTEEGIAMAGRLGDDRLLAFGKSNLGWSLFYSRAEVALELFAEATAAARAAGDQAVEMESLMGQGWTHLLLGRAAEASALADEVIELGDRIGAPYITSFALLTHGILAAERGEDARAVELYREGLRRAHAAGAHVGTALALEALATVALHAGELERGVRLAAAGDRLREEMGGNITLGELGRERPLARARRLMRGEDLERAMEEGRALSVDEAVTRALSDSAG